MDETWLRLNMMLLLMTMVMGNARANPLPERCMLVEHLALVFLDAAISFLLKFFHVTVAIQFDASCRSA